ncbi:DEAD/DEAH box helicase [Cytobacillus firmus]|jgi:ATP-dependent RNA helicase CshB|uniref:DEAD-box ATP-dependent RNA helicase CshB n=1 Tax=Cytobacillus firmus TaxID=1399 RepID=A0AA46SI25_CYTFI|nr:MULTISPECIES: DEAD/DEAH box helicase [Bacillaceae]KML37894.1 DEAD/DEAH box helicase [Cytobacillus firmus]MBG9445594.1 DEAD/DEAH box helicase [Cytobacillus firmus]MBG9448631.1 DEAD/DEAH box helicase [Cytobacillus firmus]MBG9546508.1 DEAD/DEAH box helicase [Cytobacillus firmus]MBG9603277.1 DEAD/DEAH box helicase [Cytobacillus firmus]
MNETKFDRFNLKPFIIEAVKDFGFFEPTEIQERMIPAVLKGESAIGQSQTGTGKTHSYVLPILHKVDPSRQEVQAIITAPTRELANQIYHEILKVTEHCPEGEEITARCYIGGTDKQRTIEKLKKQPHVVVGTPGRINDLVKEQALFVHTAEILIVDEADLMLDMGFIEDVDQIAARMPEKLQMLVFSATIPEKLKPFLKKYMENPKYVHVEPKQAAAANIEHWLLPSKHRNKVELVYQALTSLNPYLAIVFTNTKKKADEVADGLISKGLKVGRIHGDLNPRERKKMMKQILDLEFQYIVATDLAARGIDIQGISHVINYELPTDLDFYIHRVGRTARAGFSGIAVTVYEISDEDALNRLEKMGIEFRHKDLQKGEWTDLENRNKRKTRQKQTDDIDKKAASLVKKPKKVKPGYKKKMKWEMDKIKKRERRIKRK